MADEHRTYRHPLTERYASNEMKRIFSDEAKFRNWRRCWIALAEGERVLGLEQITPEHLRALKEFSRDIPYDRADEFERELRHDVMAHIRAYAEQVEPVSPGAGGVIHLGATSMLVGDNTDLLQIRDGLDLVVGKTINVLRRMGGYALEYADVPVLARTHYQPAQPTTFGKRIADWMYGFVLSLDSVEHQRERLRARGAKGTTGTQDSFLKLFDGKAEKVRQLDLNFARRLGFVSSSGESLLYEITAQTYPRVVDYLVLSSLGALAVVTKKMGTDLRLMQGVGEISEPFGKSQVGSSAMAYKRNPMRAERMCGLARHIIPASGESASIASEQWLERTLDDSAERRMLIPDTFLGTDGVLNQVSRLADRNEDGVIEDHIPQGLALGTTGI